MKVKLYGNYRMSSELNVLLNNYLNYSSEVNKKLIEKLSFIIYYYILFKRLLLMTYVEKMSYFEVAPPGHTISYKNVDNLLKNRRNIAQFIM